jgi:hypothetical protein
MKRAIVKKEIEYRYRGEGKRLSVRRLSMHVNERNLRYS